MAESGTQYNNKVEQYQNEESADRIKSETEVSVKAEPQECVVCTKRSRECVDMYSQRTRGSGASLTHFLNKYSSVDLSTAPACSRVLCKGCLDLINVLEQAEIEYHKLKETFVAILSKNPLFETSTVQPSLQLAEVKSEFYSEADDDEDFVCNDLDEDSDDEPLATQSKRKRQKSSKKKNVTNTGKRKGRKKTNSTSWLCNECGMSDSVGGADALVAHKLAEHSIDNASEGIQVVKTEDTEGSETTYNNGYNHLVVVQLDNTDDASLTDDIISEHKPTKKPVGRPRKAILTGAVPKKKKPKVVLQCDQCDAKYTSLGRLKQHQAKHEGSKPPYICEVCGAHYKHKRACDIHIALHKGISDWKCEECNKLFPSKNALQRHNNIHTGKLNYQCDLCGKSFIHTSSFKMHKLSHSGVKPHSCAVCGLALMTRSHLKRHARVHSGEKRHECGVCGKRFSERYNLVAHAKSHDVSGELPAAPRRRLFRCLFCAERFERRYILERHMQVTHGRALERPPPTPRNTMSKLLKAQAQRRQTAPTEADTKEDVSSDSTPRPITAQKLIAQLSATSSIITQGAWGGAYPPEFNLRPDFPH